MSYLIVVEKDFTNGKSICLGIDSLIRIKPRGQGGKWDITKSRHDTGEMRTLRSNKGEQQRGQVPILTIGNNC